MVVGLVIAILVVIFLSLFVGAAYGEYLRNKKGESSTAVELGIKSGASSCCIIMLIAIFCLWPTSSSFAWYNQMPISIIYNLISKNLKPATKQGGLLPAQTYHNKSERATSETTYRYIHLLLTATITSVFFGLIAQSFAVKTAGLFFPSGGSGGRGGGSGKGSKQPRSPFTNRPY